MSGTERRNLDLEVRRDGELLLKVVALLEAKAPLRAWPKAAKAALGSAIAPTAGNPSEIGKARRLRRHLFIDMPLPDTLRPDRPSRRADRLRADLADLTTFGAGLHLTDPAPRRP